MRHGRAAHLVLDMQRGDADLGVALDRAGDLGRTSEANVGVGDERDVAGDAGDHRGVVDKVVLVREAAATSAQSRHD